MRYAVAPDSRIRDELDPDEQAELDHERARAERVRLAVHGSRVAANRLWRLRQAALFTRPIGARGGFPYQARTQAEVRLARQRGERGRVGPFGYLG